MGFLDDISKKITQTSQNIISKANEVADVSKLNSQIAEEEKSINQNLQKLGMAYYQKYGSAPHEGMESICGAIAASNDRIADLKKQILAAKKIVTCPKCGAECESSLSFCPSCGTALPKQEAPTPPPPMPPTKYCSKCGKQIAGDATFCPFCGNKN